MSKVLVIAESNASELTVATLEVCRAAASLATTLGGSWSILVDQKAANSACSIAPEVMIYEAGDTYNSADVLAATAAQILESEEIILTAATSTGKDVIGRLAQQIGAPLAQDCTGFQVSSGEVLLQRALYGGKVISEVRLSGCPALVSFRPRSFTPMDPSESGTGRVSQVESKFDPKAEVRLEARESGERPDVTEASIVVSGGRGLQGPENWHILEDLLDALGPNAALACSRPVSDENWRPHHEHVGQTGRAISPELYIAVGISGATQHVAGIANSKCILAINKDPEAPIFKVADYGIVGDLFEVVPALTAAIRDSA